MMPDAATDKPAFMRKIRQAVHEVEPGAEVRLFGSRARGDAHARSDWDVLVLVSGDVDRERRQRIRQRVRDLEAEYDHEWFIQAIVKDREAWYEPPQVWTPFFKNVQRDTGHDPMPDEKNPKYVAHENLKRAHEALEVGEMSVEAGYLDDAVSRIYYAFFRGARALLILDDLHAKTHSGTKTLFHEHFVKEGRIDSELGGLYEELSEGREVADYGLGGDFDAATVRDWLAHTKEFLQTVETRVEDFAQ